MSMTLYHGSITPGITSLEPRSRLHGTDTPVVYLTDSIPYALFYIWDGGRNGDARKYVTGGFRDGRAFYEEQFPDQLRTFYQGVSGYLYCVLETGDARPVPNREGLFAQPGAAVAAKVCFIPDVYEELLKHEAAGRLKVLRYCEQSRERQAELTGMIASFIRQRGFFADDVIQRQFMQRHFAASWHMAEEMAD